MIFFRRHRRARDDVQVHRTWYRQASESYDEYMRRNRSTQCDSITACRTPSSRLLLTDPSFRSASTSAKRDDLLGAKEQPDFCDEFTAALPVTCTFGLACCTPRSGARSAICARFFRRVRSGSVPVPVRALSAPIHAYSVAARGRRKLWHSAEKMHS